MLGGHLDSWHAATGATDNAIGCAIMMEAARILKTLGVKPRRTIRVALWSGEEEGFSVRRLTSKNISARWKIRIPDYEKFGGYFNIDSGTGAPRGICGFRNAGNSDDSARYLAPFADLGVVGAISTKSRGLGGSDNTRSTKPDFPASAFCRTRLNTARNLAHESRQL